MRRARWLVGALNTVIGGSLLFLAVPRTIASWEAMPASSALAKVNNAKELTATELRVGIVGLQRSVALNVSDASLIDLGTLELLLAQQTPVNDPMRTQLLKTSELHLFRGLAANPANGFGWYRLAQVRQLQHPLNGRPIVVALTQSLDMAPNMRPLWLGRTLGLMAYRQFLTPDETDAFVSSLRTSWLADGRFRSQLIRSWQGNEGALAFLNKVLANDLEARQQLNELLAR